MVEFDRTRKAIYDLSFVLSRLNKTFDSNGTEESENNTDVRNSDAIKKYFTDYVVITFYSEIEEKLHGIMNSHREEFEKINLSSFLFRKNVRKRMLVLPGLSADTMNECFRIKEKIKNEFFQSYKTIIDRRHQIAHGGVDKQSNVSWEEVEEIYLVGEKIMRAIEKHLNG